MNCRNLEVKKEKLKVIFVFFIVFNSDNKYSTQAGAEMGHTLG